KTLVQFLAVLEERKLIPLEFVMGRSEQSLGVALPFQPGFLPGSLEPFQFGFHQACPGAATFPRVLPTRNIEFPALGPGNFCRLGQVLSAHEDKNSKKKKSPY